MLCIRPRVCIVGLVLTSWVGSAQGGQHTDPSGYAFKYPDGWFLIANLREGLRNAPLPPEIKNWIARNKVDMSQVSALLVRQGDEAFLENLNVVVNPGEMPLTSSTARSYVRGLTEQYRSMGISVESQDARLREIGGKKAIVGEFVVRMPMISFPIQQKQVCFAGGGKTYIVTCTGRASTFDRYAGTFDYILSSFEVPDAGFQGFDWQRVLAFAAVGGILGGLVTIMRKFANNAQTPRMPQETAATLD